MVTRLCLDYGLINDTIYFTSGEVLGGVPLREGDAVNAIAVRDGVQGGWRAIRVSVLGMFGSLTGRREGLVGVLVYYLCQM